MLTQTRALFSAYVSQIALINGGIDPSTKFAVAPTVEQRLEEVIKQGSEFLQAINIVPVTQQSGQKLGVGTTRPLAGRTDTSGAGRRVPTDPTDTSNRGTYFCRQTNSDHAIKYAILDAWRHKPEFQTLVRDVILKQQGRDRIMIGWNGTSAAATTDRVANPLLQDVNIGWPKKLRDSAPAQVISDGDLTVYANGTNNPNLKKIYVKDGVTLFDASLANNAAAAADYSNLDALVLDAKRGIAEWHRTSTDLVVIVGMDLVDEKYFSIAQKTGTTATEVEATDRILRSTKQIGGLPAVMVPFFPANAICITSLDNLSIYVQEGTRRRLIKDEPEADQIANYESVNEDYVVEDVEKMVLVENIVLGAAPARPAAP
jgi:hypothetical protein